MFVGVLMAAERLRIGKLFTAILARERPLLRRLFACHGRRFRRLRGNGDCALLQTIKQIECKIGSMNRRLNEVRKRQARFRLSRRSFLYNSFHLFWSTGRRRHCAATYKKVLGFEKERGGGYMVLIRREADLISSMHGMISLLKRYRLFLSRKYYYVTS